MFWCPDLLYLLRVNTLAMPLFPTCFTSALALPARMADWPFMTVTGSWSAVVAGVPSSLPHQACPVAGLDRKAESS
jgi:hypothetical protein